MSQIIAKKRTGLSGIIDVCDLKDRNMTKKSIHHWYENTVETLGAFSRYGDMNDPATSGLGEHLAHRGIANQERG